MGIEDKEKPASNPFFMTPHQYGVKVPIYQCLFTSGAWGGAVGTSILLAAWFEVPIPEPIKVAIAAGLLVFFVTVLITWPKYMERWMWVIESIINVDLDGSGEIGAPTAANTASPTLKVTVDMSGGTGEHMEFDEIPYPDRLPRMARAILNGADFTFAEWGRPGKLFSQPEWTALTTALREQGYIVYKNPQLPNLGFEFTRKGSQFLRDLVGEGARIERDLRPPTYLSQFAVNTGPLPRIERRRGVYGPGK